MPAAANYERNHAGTVGASLVANQEAALLESARAGDSAAFECLIMPHWDALLRVTQRVLRNREDAEDAVQAAFFDAFRSLKAFRGHSRFSSWLTRIAINAALMRLRVSRKKRETSLDEVTETGGARFHPVETRLNPEQEYLSKEVRVLLQEELLKLGAIDVEILHLRGLQELSARETAKILELPVGRIKSRLHRARAKLARHLQSRTKSRRHRGSVKN
jgi:RNA polymerase sigma-70 factor (ECF subfamily)